MVVRGAIENMNGKYLLKVSNTTDSFELDGDRSQLQALVGKEVEVQGTVPEAPKGKVPDEIQISKIEEAK